jgi:hypothetical protein
MEHKSSSSALLQPPTWDDDLLAEGYLKKIRGFAQNRNRFFRLTQKHFAFYARDSGELISHVTRNDIFSVREVSSVQIEIITRCAFGASGAEKMILEAGSPAIKERWLSLLELPPVRCRVLCCACCRS